MTKTEADLLARYAVQQILYHPVERFNVAPSQEIPVILTEKDGQRTLDSRRWGIVDEGNAESSPYQRQIGNHCDQRHVQRSV